MRFEILPWLILFLPLTAAGIILCFGLRQRGLSARLSIGAVVAGFVLGLIFVAANGWAPPAGESRILWLEVEGIRVDVGLRLDPLSLLMLLVVTGVASVIQVYSLGYMRGDPGFPRYYAGLSLFTFAMLGIVVANNFLMLFVCWELVGLASYLLIGFWYDRPAAADAGKKAFLTNRLGDFGFLIGILLLWDTLGALDYASLEAALERNPEALGDLATLAGLLIFCGAVGKSAQFPLHVWLPDAMEGPTPVSALIHAATMVAAGVYLLCRVYWLLDLPGSYALEVVAWIGGLTALLAASIALQQNDIKRILAYSTLSQLGAMMLAVGVAGPTAAMYHLSTHAFFKALLFLGAGSVIVALHHEQHIWKMGGLAGRMPVTFVTFLLATLALCGVPPFSGFYSKEAILAASLSGANGSVPLFLLMVIVTGLTALYMFRALIVAFFGRPRSEAANQAVEPDRIMTLCLGILAVPTVLGGFWGIDEAYALTLGPAPHGAAGWALIAGLAAVAAGVYCGVRWYWGAETDPLPKRLGVLAESMRNGFYLDEIYAATFVRAQDTAASLAEWIDRWVISGLLVRGLHGTTEFTGRALRLLQTGNLQTSALLMVLGLVLLIYLTLGR